MTIKLEAKNVLHQLLQTINMLSFDEYNQKIKLLSNSSIGEHTRHIIELFQQLMQGYDSGLINYDDRKRDIRIQQDIDFASETIAQIICNLNKPNKPLEIASNYISKKDKIDSNFARELMYNIEHCIHHQAIIKIGLIELNKQDSADDNFGVAKSTIEYRRQCAQ